MSVFGVISSAKLSKFIFSILLFFMIKVLNLGYDIFSDFDEVGVYPRGYRILNKIPRMPNNIIENLVQGFESFQHIIEASIEQLDNVEGIGEVRARNIKSSLRRMQEQFVFDNMIN